MNARVSLLVLVTAAFMAIWDADRPAAGRVAVAQSKLQNSGVFFANAVSNGLPLVAAEHSHPSQHDISASDSASATANSEAAIPLPKILQPGIWHATGHDGDTFRITIERNRSLTGSTSIDSLRSDGSEKLICVITAPDGTRWCLEPLKQTPWPRCVESGRVATKNDETTNVVEE